jgi:murein DD-endopeptidase MepM/ murein hydrolase activator NlpD
VKRFAAPLVLAASGACVAATGDEPAQAPRVLPSPTLPPVVMPAAQVADHVVYSGELTQGGWIRGQVPAGTTSLKLGDQNLAIADDGTFFVAFDRDAGPIASLNATLRDGRTTDILLTIAPRAWQIENIDASPTVNLPSAEFTARRQPELARIVAAKSTDTGAQGWRQDFIWPATGRISGRFGSQRVYRGEPGSYHTGIDIAARAGTTYVAPADGVVVLAADRPFTLEGNLLIVDHGMGLNSSFLHSAELLVHEGDVVRQGQPLGRVGMTGRATGPHLHWGLTWRGARLDPLLFTGPMG